jgi:hypothetical protein
MSEETSDQGIWYLWGILNLYGMIISFIYGMVRGNPSNDILWIIASIVAISLWSLILIGLMYALREDSSFYFMFGGLLERIMDSKYYEKILNPLSFILFLASYLPASYLGYELYIRLFLYFE